MSCVTILLHMKHEMCFNLITVMWLHYGQLASSWGLGQCETDLSIFSSSSVKIHEKAKTAGQPKSTAETIQVCWCLYLRSYLTCHAELLFVSFCQYRDETEVWHSSSLLRIYTQKISITSFSRSQKIRSQLETCTCFEVASVLQLPNKVRPLCHQNCSVETRILTYINVKLLTTIAPLWQMCVTLSFFESRVCNSSSKKLGWSLCLLPLMLQVNIML